MIALKKDKVREALSYFNLNSIPKRERYVLTHYYGLNGKEVKNLEEIGKDLGLSKSRIDGIKNEWMKYIVGSNVEELSTDKDLFLTTPTRARIEVCTVSLEGTYFEIIDIDSNVVSYEYIEQLGSVKWEEYKSIKYEYSNNNSKYRKRCKGVLDKIDKKVRMDCSYNKTNSLSYIRIYTEYMASFTGKVFRIYEIDSVTTFYDILKKIKDLIGNKFPIPKIVEQVINT